MSWTGDKKLETMVRELQEKYGDSALTIAASRLIDSERDRGHMAAELDRLRTKAAHGCHDAMCSECDS